MLRNTNPDRPRVHGSDHVNAGEDPVPGALIFIKSIETNSVEQVSSAAENTIQTISLPANSFNQIYIECAMRSRYEVDISNKTNNTYNIKVDGATKATFSERIIALATANADSGGRNNSHFSVITPGGQAAAVNVIVTAQMSINNANCGILCYFIRLWGINKNLRP